MIIATEGLAKRYGDTDALVDLTMDVAEGEVFGFLGPNGAGKTTAVKLLLGLARPSGGGGTVLGAPLGDRAARRRIGYLPELFRYQPWLQAREVLRLHGRLIGREADRSAGALEGVLDEVGLLDRADDAVGGFSKGMQQRLGLAVALLGGPALVILDEPTSALDPVGRADVRSIIRRAREAGTSIFLNSHLLTEVERVCDRVAIVDHGRVLASGRLDDLLGESAVRIYATELSEDAGAALARFGRIAVADNGWLTITGLDPAAIPDVVAAIVAGGGRIHAVDPGRATLEDRYLELIGAAGRGRDRLMAALTIAGLTVAEIVRRRIAWVLIGLTVVSVLLTTLGVERLVSLARGRGDAQELEIWFATSQILILVAFMFSFVLAMTAAFLAAPAIAADLESGVAQTMLARPIRRSDLVLGRWLGLVLVIAVYAAASGLLEIAALGFVTGYAPPHPWLAVAYLAAQAVVLLTFALLLSTRLPAIAAGAICVVLFGLGWMAGVFAGIGRFFDAAPLVAAAEASRWLLPSDGLWRGTIYGLEPPAVMLLALGRAGPVTGVNPFFASAPPPTEFIVWSIVWVAIVLGLAVLSLSRRDL